MKRHLLNGADDQVAPLWLIVDIKIFTNSDDSNVVDMKQWLQQSASSAYFFFFLPLHIDSIPCLFLSPSSCFCYFLFVSIPSICLFLPPCPFLCFPPLSLCSLSPFCLLFPVSSFSLLHCLVIYSPLFLHVLSPVSSFSHAYSFLPFLLIPIFLTLAPFHRLFIYPFLLSLSCLLHLFILLSGLFLSLLFPLLYLFIVSSLYCFFLPPPSFPYIFY